MAEGVFRSLAKEHPRVHSIDSAGTGAYHTLDSPDYRTMETLAKHGIRGYEHGARQVQSQDFTDFTYIFAMDANNLRNLQSHHHRLEVKGQKPTAKIMLFGHYGGKSKAEEVVDPYYGRDNGFEVVYQQVSRFSKNFLAELDEGVGDGHVK